MENKSTTNVIPTKNKHTLKNPAIITASIVAGNCSRFTMELIPIDTSIKFAEMSDWELDVQVTRQISVEKANVKE